jgi:hypothetical protein
VATVFPRNDEQLQARRRLLIDAATRAGILVSVAPEDAAAWVAEWRAAVRATLPRRRLRLLTPQRGIPRLTRPPQRDELPPVGSWVSFRPHISSVPEVFQVVAFVPVGTAIDEVLTTAQLRLLQDGIRQRCTHGDRVVLGEPGGMHLIASLRTALAGAVAARATVIPEPLVASPSRLVSPLAPGVEVSWGWHSSFGPSRRSGVVVAYVPARASLDGVVPGLRLGGRLRAVSTVDRYLVRVQGETGAVYLTPPAFLVERPAAQDAPCSSAS